MILLKDLHLRMTSKCNLNCLHCYAADWFYENHELDLNTTISLIDQAKALGCQKVTYTGGEPLVSKATIPAIKYCLDNGLLVEIESNGVLIDKLIFEAKDYVLKIEYAISYDGEKMRDPKFVKKVRSNIQTLKTFGCDVKIQTVLTPVNLDEASAIFDFSSKLDIRNRVFLAHSPNGNGKNVPLFTVKEWLGIIRSLKSKYSNLIIEVPRIFTGGTPKNCGWGYLRCEIMPNGDVTSCGPIAFNKRDFVAGNIKNHSLKELWYSKHFEDIRNISQPNFLGVCAKCSHWKNCQGACRSISLSTGGNIMSPHPFCAAFFEEASLGKLDSVEITEMAKEWLVKVGLTNARLTD